MTTNAEPLKRVYQILPGNSLEAVEDALTGIRGRA
jgi:hypothetical protein